MAITAAPAFARIPADDRKDYDAFIKATTGMQIRGYASGWNIEKLAQLAEKAYAVIRKTNPILDEGSPQADVIRGRQWELNQLSDIKQRLANAIVQKRAYYDNHVLGMITKFFLKCIGKWNDGNTSSIVAAEDFLLKWDTRLPVSKNASGFYETRLFLPLTSAAWIRQNLNTDQFFNYNPMRTTPLVRECRYDAINPGNPQVVIFA